MNATTSPSDSATADDMFASLVDSFLCIGTLTALQVTALIMFLLKNDTHMFSSFNVLLVSMGICLCGDYIFNGVIYMPAWSTGGTDLVTVTFYVIAYVAGNGPIVIYTILAYQRGMSIIGSRQYCLRLLLWWTLVLEVVLNVVSSVMGILQYTVHSSAPETQSSLAEAGNDIFIIASFLLSVFDILILYLFVIRVQGTHLAKETLLPQFAIICSYGSLSSLLCLLSAAFSLAYFVFDTPWITWILIASQIFLSGVWWAQIGMKIALVRASERVTVANVPDIMKEGIGGCSSMQRMSPI
ncbi:hypothetical protein BC830DRAFT_1140936 [Chytriomyces sp. MP71]|nr:hypothetical protein BC830DRAFT_1140936 [Chytriomyces sp. MP71]